MRCIFNKVTLHNFLSFGDATVELRSKGYCLIKGRNTNPSDRALSNGAGKSTIVSSICWAITGQTVQGVKSNIENMFTTGGCFVSVDFNIDGDNYVVTRYKNHEQYKTDLKIIMNGKDISGKGIRESENVLATYLPDITFDLLSSIIFLGQGLPNSFTKSTPSGRKEKLETLTKSDFMIQDVKNRIAKRQEVLDNKVKGFREDNIQVETSLTYSDKRLQQVKNELEKLTYNNYEEELRQANIKLVELQKELEALTLRYEDETARSECLNKDITSKYEAFSKEYQETSNEGGKIVSEIDITIALTKNKISYLEDEIRKLDNIKDICPTCGQKLPNVHKVDTTDKKNELTKLKEELKKSIDNKENETTRYKSILESMKTQYNRNIEPLQQQYKDLMDSIKEVSMQRNSISSQMGQCQGNINTYVQLLSVYNTQKTKLEQEENELTSNIMQLNEKLLYNNKELDELQASLDILSKINTLVKRDFRGYLLQNIIAYIESKAKEYCKYIFGTSNLDIKQDRNEIMVAFCGKEYEALSGGEKQKVDLIIQFAIRDMMSKYLNFNSNILFLDEITDNLDSVGCSGLMSLISNVLNDVESVFIISHHSDELSLPIDTEIVIEKDSSCISRIIN